MDSSRQHADKTSRLKGFELILVWKTIGLEHTGLRSSRQAVVSSIPGTTRDYIEGSITWDGTEVSY
eukprot:1363041-Amorphochlora_amoeboformis.AAC.1